MSRTTLCLLTAAGLVAVSAGLMVSRYYVLGDEVKLPRGPNTWKVSLKASGISTTADAKLLTQTPLDMARQHISNVVCRSPEMLNRLPSVRHPERREVLWSQRAGVPPGPFCAYYEFFCTVDFHHPTTSMGRLASELYQAPAAGEYLASEPRVECDQVDIAGLARRLTAGKIDPSEQVEALYEYVDHQMAREPAVRGPRLGAVECLNHGAGDAAAKSRLLVALCRNRRIPARLVTGLHLTNGPDQVAHAWAEAWLHDRWLPMCAYNHHFGHVPASYLVFALGDVPMVRGRNVRDLEYAFLVERTASDDTPAADPWPIRRIFKRLDLHTLPPSEERLVEFLLLVPVAAMIVCLFRQLIGVATFGTFAPALVGLAFRELHSLPGILVFVAVILIGWGMRHVLHHYHLLQVPRTAFMLSLVVLVLIAAIMTANLQNPPVPATKYISLFPIIILTGMIERFWTLETEDSTSSSFKTLLGTMVVAATISLVLSLHALVHHLVRYPETLGLIMACQLLLGRYTGYRLSELLRFRDFVRAAEAS